MSLIEAAMYQVTLVDNFLLLLNQYGFGDRASNRNF